MKTELRDRLDAAFDSYSVLDRMHDVPPHEVWEVTVDGRRAVCKFDTGETGSAGMEGHVTAFLGERTTVPVPEVLDCDEDYYVAEFHPDAPSLDGEFDADEQWAEATGRGLARLHEETADHLDWYGQFQPANAGGENGWVETTGHAEWQAAAIEFVRHYRPTLVEYGHGDIADTAIEFLEDNPDIFAGAGDPVCCHGWATPEHVAVRDGEVACLVDFEHAIAAPGEFDYWRTVIPTFGPELGERAERFREGYESVRPLPDGFEDRRPGYVLLNLIYFFESLYVQDQHDPEATEQKAEQLRDRVIREVALW